MLRGSRLRDGAEQGLVGRAGRRRGLDAQLANQRGCTGVVGAKGPGPVTRGVVEADQQPVGLLAERVVPQEPLGIADRLGEATLCLEVLGEVLEGAEVELPQALALLEHPVVVVALDQVAAVRLDRVLQTTLRDGLLERLHVDPHRHLLAPPQRSLSHVEEPIRLRQRPAKVVQDVARRFVLACDSVDSARA